MKDSALRYSQPAGYAAPDGQTSCPQWLGKPLTGFPHTHRLRLLVEMEDEKLTYYGSGTV
jgi:hypothetical protein